MENGSRYLIYSLLHRNVSVSTKTGKRVRGLVGKVYRNIMECRVEVTVNGREVAFAEPTFIRLDGDDVVFEYGRTGTDDSDETLFAEANISSSKGESLHETMKRTATVSSRQTRFCCLAPA